MRASPPPPPAADFAPAKSTTTLQPWSSSAPLFGEPLTSLIRGGAPVSALSFPSHGPLAAPLARWAVAEEARLQDKVRERLPPQIQVDIIELPRSYQLTATVSPWTNTA